jgi:hypothetical protein
MLSILAIEGYGYESRAELTSVAMTGFSLLASMPSPASCLAHSGGREVKRTAATTNLIGAEGVCF